MNKNIMLFIVCSKIKQKRGLVMSEDHDAKRHTILEKLLAFGTLTKHDASYLTNEVKQWVGYYLQRCYDDTCQAIYFSISRLTAFLQCNLHEELIYVRIFRGSALIICKGVTIGKFPITSHTEDLWFDPHARITLNIEGEKKHTKSVDIIDAIKYVDTIEVISTKYRPPFCIQDTFWDEIWLSRSEFDIYLQILELVQNYKSIAGRVKDIPLIDDHMYLLDSVGKCVVKNKKERICRLHCYRYMKKLICSLYAIWDVEVEKITISMGKKYLVDMQPNLQKIYTFYINRGSGLSRYNLTPIYTAQWGEALE